MNSPFDIPRSESRSIEFKQQFSQQFLKTVSAFATYTGGEIIFGLSDGGAVVGVSDAAALKLQIENAIRDTVSPQPEFSLSEQTVSDKIVLRLLVPKGKAGPYFYQHRVFRRNDTATMAVDAVEIKRLVMDVEGIEFEELPAKQKKLSFKLLEDSLKKAIDLQVFNDDTLRTLGLLAAGRYNIAAELLADTNSRPELALDMVRFGENDNIFIERETFEGRSLIEQYQSALKFFDRWYHPYEEVSGFYRETRVPIPRDAFREAIANALFHRDFSIPATVRVAMRASGIEITSPGGLPPGVTPEEYRAGSVSVPRNKIIAAVFHRLKIIERFATGIRRIKSEYADRKEQPSLISGTNFVKIVLPAAKDVPIKDVTTSSSKAKSGVKSGNVGVNDVGVNVGVSKKILESLKDNASLTVPQLALALNLNTRTIERHIDKLRNEHIIIRIGARKNGRWRINETNVKTQQTAVN